MHVPQREAARPDRRVLAGERLQNRTTAYAALLWAILAVGAHQDLIAAERMLPDVVGVTHVSGRYHLTDADFLNEGADQILSLGSRVIKVYFTVPPTANPSSNAYPFNSRWPQAKTLTELAATPYFRALFDKPFTTFILTTYAAGRPEHYWRAGVTAEQVADEERQFYELARHFHTAYRGQHKTFVLQHWEGDWAIRGNFDPQADPTPQAIQGMIDWLNARQAGVDRARQEFHTSDVSVYHAAEVNLVKASMIDGRPGVANRVVPQTRVDLVSYSAWDTQSDPVQFRQALAWLAEQTPDRPPFGGRNVYVGEFGAPQNEWSAEQATRTIRNAVETSLDVGCPYVIFWQLYCNELRPGEPPPQVPVRSNDAVRGFWLIRPDGTKAWSWDYLQRVLATPTDLGVEERGGV